jgi:4-amino-4-deoxy-L-arabinose transferase-like glycosyltransferase
MAIRMRRPLLAAGLVLYFAAILPWLLSWGATRQERRQPLPGDDLVPARWQTTRAQQRDADDSQPAITAPMPCGPGG